MKFRFLPLGFAAALLHWLVVAASAEMADSTGLNVTAVDINANGSYSISTNDPRWKLEGTLPGPASNIVSGNETDALGGCRRTRFDYMDAGRPMTGAIRIYNNGVIVFSESCPQGSAAPPSPFPDFTTVPRGLHFFSYADEAFSPGRFNLNSKMGPWLFYDDEDNAMVISPASHFVCTRMTGDGKGRVASGFSARLSNIPAGFTQQTILALGHGINREWDAWGRAMTDLQGKRCPANDADIFLKYYGYWTDNGAAYWYNYDSSRGYQGTLQAVADEYRAENIPIRYMQLDSWWYQKTTTQANGKPGQPKNSKLPAGEWNRYGGTLRYRADPFVFPNGIEAFHESTGLPFITHNRWIDPASPYHLHYKISGIAAVDPGFWDEIATYLESNGVMAYEQDWLSDILKNSPGLSSTVDEGDAFFGGMANACGKHGLSVQYCMATPVCFLQGSKYGNLTTIRVSGDRFMESRYRDFLYTSRLAFSLGIWPWVDVFNSTEIDNLLLSTLSAGPVGTGDALGRESRENIMMAVRADGVIVKPDAPLLPVDRAYLAGADGRNIPLVAATYTDHGGVKTIYCVALSGTGSDAVTLDAADLGCGAGPVYVYDYFAGTGERMEGGTPLPIELKGRKLSYYVIAPVGSSGIALVGDAGKFVGMGRKRIADLNETGDALSATVLMAANEKEVCLRGYSATAPVVTVKGGVAEPVEQKGGLFTVTVKADLATPAFAEGGDSVRKVAVTFRKQ